VSDENGYPNFLEHIRTTLKEGEGKKPVCSFPVDLPASATFSPTGELSLVFYWGVGGIDQGLPIEFLLSSEAVDSLRTLLSHDRTPGVPIELSARRASQ
jgi:hypothetical protein